MGALDIITAFALGLALASAVWVIGDSSTRWVQHYHSLKARLRR